MFLRAIIRLLLMICFLQHTLTFTSDELRITLSNGSKLVGRYLRAYSGRPIKAFTNIPYAKPPVGPLRFKVSINKNQNYQKVNYFMMKN